MNTKHHFADDLIRRMQEKKSVLAVGLDPQLKYMPQHLIKRAMAASGSNEFRSVAQTFVEFNRRIIDAVHDIVPAVKPQSAFYEKYGSAGVEALEDTIEYAQTKGLVVILDAKRGDGSDTADAYADGYLGEVEIPQRAINGEVEFFKAESPIRVDCMTVQPYIADDCVGRFIRVVKKEGTGIFIVTKTSFKPNSRVEQLDTTSGRKVWQEVAQMAAEWGEGTEGEEGYRNVGVVMGATYPEDAPAMRKILPNSILLIPGYGKQGGDADAAVAGFNADGLGGIVNSSRGIIYAYREAPSTNEEHFAARVRSAAEHANRELNDALKRAGKYNF